ncbi:hypothetical protein B0A52_07492 [Exophiala mesophila]|uniref:Uncharacterized protein n=1 Tax=Exophiala mesophila TaxID=212818 RepID=A0A438MYL3_EXOME|nr:hypothetical protein B0A52_07492 [Exophiala mesophila]
MAVFEDNPHCRQCGLSTSEGDIKMQDDLINLMTRNLNLNPLQHQHQQNLSMPPTPQVVPQPAPVTYITQHYHHSGHQAPAHEVSVSTILENVGVDHSALLPSQLALFKNAGEEQRQRLIELWQISPPTYGNQMHPSHLGNWPEASMEREEEAARYRLQIAEEEKSKSMLPGVAGSESRNNAEPYIVQGYANLPNINGNTAPMEYRSVAAPKEEYKPSSDPAYNSREWWNLSDDEPMEHQYGMLQAYAYAFPVDYSVARRSDGDSEMS